jgi:hypothetical protein
MEILCITGPVPGVVTATVSHGADVRSVKLEIGQHPTGGWHARGLAAPHWGLRCHTVPTAVLLEAAEVFADEPMLLAAD